MINGMSEWMKRQLGDRMVLPGSAIGKAVRYSADRWDELSNYLYDGNLCIDNNGVENAIRPVALGYVKLSIMWAGRTSSSPDPTRRHNGRPWCIPSLPSARSMKSTHTNGSDMCS